MELARHNAGAPQRNDTLAESSAMAIPALPLLGTEVTRTAKPKRFWEGAYASTAPASPKQVAICPLWENPTQGTERTAEFQCYGPSSLFYFIGRIEAHMTWTLQEQGAARPIWFNSATKSLPSLVPDSERSAAAREASTGTCMDGNDGGSREFMLYRVPGDHLNASQEENFLALFWSSHHRSLQIVGEATFREN